MVHVRVRQEQVFDASLFGWRAVQPERAGINRNGVVDEVAAEELQPFMMFRRDSGWDKDDLHESAPLRDRPDLPGRRPVSGGRVPSRASSPAAGLTWNPEK
jgi:hypothetical protein